MTLETARLVTRCIVLGSAGVVLVGLAGWLAWDLYAYLKFGREATESHLIYELSQRHPWAFLPIFLGLAFLAFHFFVGPEPAASAARVVARMARP